MPLDLEAAEHICPEKSNASYISSEIIVHNGYFSAILKMASISEWVAKFEVGLILLIRTKSLTVS